MNRKLDFIIEENDLYLKKLLLNEKDIRIKERIQFIYLIKIGEIKRINQGAKILIKDRRTLGNWIKKYEQSGLSGLLERNTSNGRPSQISDENLAKLKDKLSNSEGFKSYKTIKIWILEEFGQDIPYKTVFRICHDKLGASPKVSRPKNPKQDPEKLEEFKKKHLKK